MIKNFYDLTVWEESHDLSIRIYEVTKSFLPRKSLVSRANCEERFRPYRQTVRKVSANSTLKTRLDFTTLRVGLYETQNFLLLSRGLGYLKGESTEELLSQLLSQYVTLCRRLHVFIMSTNDKLNE